MFYFLCRTLHLCRNRYTVKAQNPSMAVSSSLRYFSTDANYHSFTINYLVNQCGLSPEEALSASKKVQLKTSQKPDLIVSFFEKHGFVKSDVSEMIRKLPGLLLYNPEKIISPKVEFFHSKFASTLDLVRIFTSYPRLLGVSLEKHLIPSFNLFKDLLQSEEKAITAVKRNPWVLALSLKRRLIPRAAVIEFLSSKGLVKLDSRITNQFFVKEKYFVEMFMNYREEAPHLLKLYNEKLDNFADRCRLSLESASKTPVREIFEKPNLVLSFFEKIGISKTQITIMIRIYPEMLSPNEEKIIFPKVQFLYSKGFSTPDLVRLFTRYTSILTKSLENHWVPSFNIFRDLLQSEEKAIMGVRQSPRILCCCPQSSMIYNINSLIENGVPATNVLRFVDWNYRCIEMDSNKFGKILEEVREMGLNPLKSQFVIAIKALAAGRKSLDQKFNIYKRWGWSEEDITAAFKRDPWCMIISDDKLMATMDFYVNKMGLDSEVIIDAPGLLRKSLKKTLIPRASVIEFLSSKGLAKLDSNIISSLKCTEMRFLEKFVNCHEEAPLLLKLYKEKLDCVA